MNSKILKDMNCHGEFETFIVYHVFIIMKENIICKGVNLPPAGFVNFHRAGRASLVWTNILSVIRTKMTSMTLTHGLINDNHNDYAPTPPFILKKNYFDTIMWSDSKYLPFPHICANCQCAKVQHQIYLIDGKYCKLNCISMPRRDRDRLLDESCSAFRSKRK